MAKRTNLRSLGINVNRKRDSVARDSSLYKGKLNKPQISKSSDKLNKSIIKKNIKLKEVKSSEQLSTSLEFTKSAKDSITNRQVKQPEKQPSINVKPNIPIRSSKERESKKLNRTLDLDKGREVTTPEKAYEIKIESNAPVKPDKERESKKLNRMIDIMSKEKKTGIKTYPISGPQIKKIPYPFVTRQLQLHFDAENMNSVPFNIDPGDTSLEYDFTDFGTTIFDLHTPQQNAFFTGSILRDSLDFNRKNPKLLRMDRQQDPNHGINFGDFEIFNNPTDFTFSLWIKFRNLDNDRDIWTKGNHAIRVPILVWYDKSVSGTIPDAGAGNSNTISFITSDGDGSGSDYTNQHWISAPSNSIELNRVYNIVVQHTTTGLARIWIDGVLVVEDTKPSVTGMKNSTAPLRINRPNNDDASQQGNSDLYQIAMYNTLLDAEEIKVNYNNMITRFETNPDFV